MAALRELTQTHASAHVVRWIDQAKHRKPNRRRKRIRAFPFIYAIYSLTFFRVGLMFFFMYAGGVAPREALDNARERVSVDLVDFGPPDLDHMHLRNARPSISLVKSNGCDLISHPANRVTRGCLWTL